MSRLSWVPVAVALALPTLAAAFPSPAHALTRDVRHSIASPQRVGAVRLVRDADGAQRLRFAIAYPRVGRSAGRGWVRVQVFDSAARHRVLATVQRKVGTSWKRVVHGSVVLPERAHVHSLKAVTVSSFHERPLGGGHSHTMAVGVVAARAAHAVSLRSLSARAAGDTVQPYTVSNDTATAVRLTAAPVSCMYDNGQGGSNASWVSNFNGVTLAAGGALSANLQADGNVTHDVEDQYTPAANHKGASWASPWIDPDYANGLHNADVRAFLFTAINKYTSTVADPETFQYVQESVLPNQDDGCAVAGGAKFAIGADQFVSGTSATTANSPTRAHTEVLLALNGKNDVAIQSPLFPASDATTQYASPYLPGYPNGEPWIAAEETGGQSLAIEAIAPVGGAINTGGPDWMIQQFPTGSGNANTPLYDVAFPGTHDSATGSLMSNDDWLLKTSSDPCSSYDVAFNISAGEVYNLGATQHYDIQDQLDLGIRYLDLRTAYTDYPGGGDSSAWSTENPTWRPLHTMFAQTTLETEAQTIASWAAGHPSEILIADFNHVCQESATDAGGFMQALTAPDPVTGVSLCDVAYTLPAGTSMSDLPATALQTMRNSRRNVAVLLDPSANYGSSGCGYPLVDQTQRNAAGSAGNVPINHLWPDVNGPVAQASCDAATAGSNATPAGVIQQYPLSADSPGIGTAPPITTMRSQTPIPLTQTQTQYTVSAVEDIVQEVLLCGTLLNWESSYAADYRPGVITAWGPNLNIVIGDGVDGSYISSIAELNADPARGQ